MAEPRAPFRITPTVFHVLLSLQGGAAHAYGMMKDVSARTGGTVRIGPGSLHFTLTKLLDAAMIAESDDRPDPSEDDARRKYFELTEYGREVLRAELTTLAGIVDEARDRDVIPQRADA